MKFLLTILCLLNLGIALALPPVLDLKELKKPPGKVIRTCCAFGDELSISGVPFLKKTDITSVEFIGEHQFLGGKAEGNGIVYTTRGGFIDLGHLRDCADWTAYLYLVIQQHAELEEDVELKLGLEGGSKMLYIPAPHLLPKDSLVLLSGRMAYDLSLWHEIATWYGASFVPGVSEKFSSFSPEDLYSNLQGVHLGMKAIESELPFEQAMSDLLAAQLEVLGVVESREETVAAMNAVENEWWNNEVKLPKAHFLLERYMDEKGALEPWLVNGANIEEPYILIKPPKKLSQYYSFQIDLNRKFKGPISAFEVDTSITHLDFSAMVARIEQDHQLEQMQPLTRNQKHIQRKVKKKSEREQNKKQRAASRVY